jgi:CheY-like chemotaxis protein
MIASTSLPNFEFTKEHAVTEEKRMPDQRLKDISVLAVDDDADTRVLVKTILERSGAYTTVVNSGKEVLEIIKHICPDILICDLAMPQMSGYELLENVRRLETEIGWLPVIALTASARTQDLTESRRGEFEAHLAKPLIPNELVATIAKLVRMRTRNETDVRTNTESGHHQ